MSNAELFASYTTQVSDILASNVVNGEVRINLGDLVDGIGIGADAGLWGVDGFVSRPNDPSDDGACQAIYSVSGNQKRVVATRDNRFSVQTGNLAEGDRAIVSDCAARFVLKKERGSLSFITTDDNTNDGRAIYLTVSPDKGFEFSSPWGRITCGPLGIHLLHSSGARLDLGAIGGLPGPLASLSSYAKLEAAMTSVKGGIVSMGTDGGAANEVAVAALNTFIAALVTAIGTITTVTPGASAMAAITPLLAPLTLALAGIGKVV